MALGIPKDPAGQKKLLAGLLPILLLGAYYQFFHGGENGKKAEVETLQIRYEELTAKNDAARAKTSPAAVRDMRQKLDLWQQHLVELEELIPQREEVPALLYSMSERASQAGIDLAKYTPEGEEQQEYYSRQTYTVRVVGNYHAIGRFLAMTGSLPRIITATEARLSLPAALNVNRRPDAAPRLQLDFKIHTYIIPPDSTATSTPMANAGA